MTGEKLFNSVDELLPHSGQMVLITDVLDWGDDWLEASVDHRRASSFRNTDGSIPAWNGMEYMSQAIGALVGVQAKQAGRPIRIGLLMGTRKYESAVHSFEKDSVLTVRVEEVFSDKTSLAMFGCRIFSGDVVLATAQIKAIMPDNIASVLGGMMDV